MEPLNNKKKTIISIVATCVVITGLTVFCGYLLTRNNVLAKENQELRAENHYSNVLAPPPLPYSITFAGENVPLDNLMVRESLDRELTAICFQHGTTLMCLKRSGRWFPLIEKILKEEGLPEDFKYLCIAESSLQNAISPAKAVGFWQFLEGTARSYGLEVTDEVDERYDVEKATRAACKY
ncbi:MAG: transglycosylase SLT domain-containing protein, partial [Bacteroidales bacterium]|nr:transglycosylase SLT domain-containing protein [Bacteroidales bacterium]